MLPFFRLMVPACYFHTRELKKSRHLDSNPCGRVQPTELTKRKTVLSDIQHFIEKNVSCTSNKKTKTYLLPFNAMHGGAKSTYPVFTNPYTLSPTGIEPRTPVSKTDVITISLSERILFACLIPRHNRHTCIIPTLGFELKPAGDIAVCAHSLWYI